MKHSINFLPLLLALGAKSHAQTQAPVQPSAAEQTFRDGWWAESGQNDLDGALRLYLAAAIAEGPAPARGKALLHAGALQQRLGKVDAAIATLRQVLREHGSDAELSARAQAHLRELTAVDLRKNYDEWYERRLFSEETQLQVLAKVQELAEALASADSHHGTPAAANSAQRATAAKAVLIGFGKGAGPALRKAAVGKQQRLAHAAIELLFEIGELPPLEALARGEGFGHEDTHWTLLLAPGNGGPLPNATPASPLQRLVAAARHSPADLLRALANTTDATLLQDGIVTAAGRAILQQDAGLCAEMLGVITSSEAAWATRRALGACLVGDFGPPVELTAAQWLDVSADPAFHPLRAAGVLYAVRQLEPTEGDLFDQILARIRSTLPRGRAELADALSTSLAQHATPDRLPWSPARLRGVVSLATSALPMLTTILRSDPRLRPMLAKALLEQPTELCREMQETGEPDSLIDRLRNHFNDEGESHDLDLLVQRWSDAMAKELAAQWAGLDDAARKAALLILRATVREQGVHDELLATLGKLRASASTELQAELGAAITSYSASR